MIGQDSTAGPEAVVLPQSGQHQNAAVVRRTILLALSTIVLLLGIASMVHAANLNWYWPNGNHENCWQTGQLGSESKECDYVGPGFLETPGRLVTGGVGQNVQRPTSGDYCNYYGLPTLNKGDSANESGATGFETPTPYSKYQEWDGKNDVCQANGSEYGQELRKSGCSSKTCGMGHYVSLYQQGYNDQPWSSVFSNPSLVLSTEADVQTLSGKSPGAWGYVCPVFQDMNPPHNILEYCLQEWRGSGNAKPEWEDEGVGTCAYGPSSNAIDTVQTYFWSGTAFAENLGSGTTGVASAGWKTYSARITEANLRNAIELDRKPYKERAGNGSGEATPELGYGCGREHELSTEPKNFSLIGIEQGTEGWSFTEIGASANNLQLYTEYTPRPPTVSTGIASGLQETQAALNGMVNPNGADTHYYFQYGTTTAYGDAVPAPPGNDVGRGGVSEPASIVTTSLEPATVYHYRIVAENSTGRTYGGDQEFTTPGQEIAPTPLVRDPGSGNQWLYYTSHENTLWYYYSSTFNGTSWAPVGGIASAVAPGSTPSAVRSPATGEQWVYYVAGNSELWYYYYNGAGWGPLQLGASVKSGTSPAVVRDPSTGDQWVYYVASNNEIWYYYYNGVSWGVLDLGPHVAPNASPTVVRDQGSGQQWVYYVGTDNTLWVEHYNGSNWVDEHLGAAIATGTHPSMVRNAASGQQWVYYVASNGELWYYYYNGSSWGPLQLGATIAASSSVAAVRSPVSGQQWVYYVSSNGELWYYYYNGSSWGALQLGATVKSGTSPLALRDPITGEQWVDYIAATNAFWEYYYNGTNWNSVAIGGL